MYARSDSVTGVYNDAYHKMAPSRPALAQSETKARFFERLGMDENNEAHRRLYAMMKEEAVEGRRRMTATPDSLAPQFRNDPSVEPPYSSAQISDAAIHQEVIRIYHSAQRDTKYIYDLGRDSDSVAGDNWIIRWMLWHVFRYRDSRNKNRRTVSPSSGGSPSEPASASETRSMESNVPTTTGSSISTSPTSTSKSRYWDPVRDG